jgi:hypothetical protein
MKMSYVKRDLSEMVRSTHLPNARYVRNHTAVIRDTFSFNMNNMKRRFPLLYDLQGRKVHHFGDKHYYYELRHALNTFTGQELMKSLRNLETIISGKVSALTMRKGFGGPKKTPVINSGNKFQTSNNYDRNKIDYPDNYWIPPYEVPVEPNYFPGYNIQTYDLDQSYDGKGQYYNSVSPWTSSM